MKRFIPEKGYYSFLITCKHLSCRLLIFLLIVFTLTHSNEGQKLNVEVKVEFIKICPGSDSERKKFWMKYWFCNRLSLMSKYVSLCLDFFLPWYLQVYFLLWCQYWLVMFFLGSKGCIRFCKPSVRDFRLTNTSLLRDNY